MKLLCLTLTLTSALSAFAGPYCCINYVGPKLDGGGRCTEEALSRKACEKLSEETFNSKPTVTKFEYSRKEEGVILRTWESQYRNVTMQFSDGSKEVKKQWNRNILFIVPKLLKTKIKSCNIKACMKVPDPGSCWDACDLDSEFGFNG